MTSEITQLILIRQFAGEADHLLGRETSFGDGQAVSMMQDAVELLVRAILRSRNINVDKGAPLDKMADAIDKHEAGQAGKVPHRVRLEDLNKARVNFKHLGISPAREDARRLVRYGVEFLEVAVPQFFDIEFRRISLARLIRSEAIVELIEAAQTALDEERFSDVMVETSDAVARVENSLLKVIPLPVSPLRSMSPDSRAISELLKYLNSLRSVAVAAMMQFDLRDLLKFRAIAPRVSRSVSGERSIVFDAGRAYNREQAQSAIDFAIEFALAVQSRLN